MNRRKSEFLVILLLAGALLGSCGKMESVPLTVPQTPPAQLIDWEQWAKVKPAVTQYDLGELFLVAKVLMQKDCPVILYSERDGEMRLGLFKEGTDQSLVNIPLTDGFDIAVTEDQIIVLGKTAIYYYDSQLQLTKKQDWAFLDADFLTQPRLSAGGKSIGFIAQDKLPRLYNIATKQATILDKIKLPDGGTVSAFSYIDQEGEGLPIALIGTLPDDSEAYCYFFYTLADHTISRYLQQSIPSERTFVDTKNSCFWYDAAGGNTINVTGGLAFRQHGFAPTAGSSDIEIAALAGRKVYQVGVNPTSSPLLAAEGSKKICCVTVAGSQYCLVVFAK